MEMAGGMAPFGLGTLGRFGESSGSQGSSGKTLKDE